MTRDPKLDHPSLDAYWNEQQKRAESVFRDIQRNDPREQAVQDLIFAAGRVIRAYTMSDEQAGISGQDELNYAITDVLAGALKAIERAKS